MTYIKLIIKEKLYSYRNSMWAIITDTLKYLFIFASLFSAVYNHERIEYLLQNDKIIHFINSGKFALLTILIGTLIAHFSIKISRQLPLIPFQYILSRKKLIFTNYVYPLISSVYFIIFFQLFIITQEMVFSYFLIFYFSYLFSKKYMYYRIIALILPIVLLMQKDIVGDEILIISITLTIFLIVISYDIITYFNKKSILKINGTMKIDSIIIKKEVEFFKYYKSELIYTLWGFLMIIFFSIAFLNEHSTIAPFTHITMEIIVFFIPFSMTKFNLFGMDFQNLPLYLTNIESTYYYQKKRLFNYFLILYIIIVIYLSLLFILDGEFTAILKLLITGVIISEFIHCFALLISIMFANQKEVKWRYGQYISSSFIYISPLAAVFIFVLCKFIYGHWGMFPIAILGITIFVFNYFLLDKIAIKAISTIMRSRYANKKYI